MKHTKFTKVASIFLILALLAIPAAAAAAPNPPAAPDVEPTNYCTSVTVQPVNTAGDYRVRAVGSGQWARCVINGTQTVVCGPTDFGAGATIFLWPSVPLVTGQVIQVQTSHTSATSGYSTTGCITTVPAPLNVELEYYYALTVPGGADVHWMTVTELHSRYFAIYRHGSQTAPGVQIAVVQAQSSGSTAGASYTYSDRGPVLASRQGRWYSIEAVSTTGHVTRYGPFQATATAP